MKSSSLALLAGAVLSTSPVPAADSAALQHWPQWRGPLATGVAPQARPPVSWNEADNVKWKFDIPGYGTSTPIIWGNQVFLLTAIPAGAGADAAPPAPPQGGRGGFGPPPRPTEAHQFVVLSVDRATGKERWRQVAREELPHEGHHRDHGFASYSPVTDGQNLYVHYGSRGLYAYDLKGHQLWAKDLGRMRTRNGFGEGGSPAVHGDVLVINWDHEGDDFIAAFNKNTGAELWRQPREELTTWTTPLIVQHNGRAQVVVTATERIRSYDLATGRQLWECGGMTGNVIPTPVAKDDIVYAISGFRGAALLAIRLGHTGDLTDSPQAIAWRHDRDTPYVPSPVLSGDRLFFFKGNNGQLSCLSARDGRPWIEAERLADLPGVYASPLAANGRVYLVGREGKTVVIKDDTTLDILATNTLDDHFDASPAAAGRQLFLRGHESLYCLEEG